MAKYSDFFRKRLIIHDFIEKLERKNYSFERSFDYSDWWYTKEVPCYLPSVKMTFNYNIETESDRVTFIILLKSESQQYKEEASFSILEIPSLFLLNYGDNYILPYESILYNKVLTLYSLDNFTDSENWVLLDIRLFSYYNKETSVNATWDLKDNILLLQTKEFPEFGRKIVNLAKDHPHQVVEDYIKQFTYIVLYARKKAKQRRS